MRNLVSVRGALRCRNHRSWGLAALWAAGLVLLVLLSAAPAALAHAILTRSDPADGAVIARAPAEVRLWFSEATMPKFSQARLLDVQGAPVAGTNVQTDPADPTLLILKLPPLPDSTYNVVYGTLSADDGHAVQGHIAFTVGAAARATGNSQSTGTAPGAGQLPGGVETGLRWLNLIAMAGLFGALPVAFLLLRSTRGERTPHAPRGAPATTQPSQGDQTIVGHHPPVPGTLGEVGLVLAAARRRVLTWGAWCAAVALVTGAAILIWEATTLQPAGASEGLLPTLAALIGGTRGGQLWLQRTVLLAVLTGLFWTLQRDIAGNASAAASASNGSVLALLAAAALGTQALAGHAAALAPAGYLAVFMDWLHLMAAGLWLGSLLALVVGLLPLALRRRSSAGYPALLAAGWQPFGVLAAFSVGVLFATGLYSMGREVASPDALLLTVYGRALLIKAALVLGMGAFGLLNATLLHKELAAPWRRILRRPSGWTPVGLRRFPLLVLLECSLGLSVLLASGVLTSTSPPHGPAFAPAPVPKPMDPLGDHVDNLILTFQATPNQAGTNTFEVGVLSHEGPPTDVLRVILRFSYLGQEAGTVSVDAQQVAPALFRLVGSQVSLAGPWQVDLVVRRKGLEDTIGHFRWTVAAPPRRIVVSDRPWEPALTTLAALLLVLVLLASLTGLARSWIRRTSHRSLQEQRQHPERP